MRVRKGLEIAWGHRVRGEPTGFDNIDSDDEADMSLQASQQRAEARELEQRRKLKVEARERRFVLVKEGEHWLGDHTEGAYAFGVFGRDTVVEPVCE